MKLYFPTLQDGLTHLKISKTSYWRMRKKGLVHDGIELVEGKKMWVIVFDDPEGEGEPVDRDPKITSLFTHRRFVKEWVQWREAGLGIRPWSQRYKKDALFYINKYFERWDLIAAESLETWLKETPAIQVSLRKHKHSPVSSLARFLYEVKGILDLDEYTKIKLLFPKKPPEYEPEQHLVGEDDVENILAAIAHYRTDRPDYQLLLKTVIILLSESALRIDECCNLRIDQLKFGHDPRKACIAKVKGKGGKTRDIPFSKRAQSAVREYLDNRHPRTPSRQLFYVYHEVHKKYSTMKANWVLKEFREELGPLVKKLNSLSSFKFTAHSFRHYRITEWANDPRIPITATQKWAGHSSLEVTQKYIHTSDEQALRAAIG